MDHELTTLGELRLRGAPGDLLKGRRKELALLAYLARVAPRPATRDQLVALFWEGREERRGRASLRQALLILKRTLGSSIEISADAVRVDPALLGLDATQFETDLLQGRLVEAVARWRGDFLAGMEDAGSESFRSWLEVERASLRHRLAAAFERLVGAAEQEGNLAGALEWAASWTAVFPWEETASLRRIHLLRRRGALVEARQVHASFVARLAAELGTEPGEELRRLGDELARASRGSEPDSSAAMLRPDLIGRRAHLASLRALWNRVRIGGTGALLVEGEPGAGLTRLLDDFVQEVESAGQPMLLLKGNRDDGLDRLGAGLAAAAGVGGASPNTLARAALWVPAIRDRFPRLPQALPVGPVEPALVEVIRQAAVEAPVLIVLDEPPDHDPRVLPLLATVVRAAVPRVLIVLAARSEVLDMPAVRHAASRMDRLKLPPLDLLQVENLIDSMVALRPEHRRQLADRLVAIAGGNPFFLVEIIHALVDAGQLLLDSGGNWSLGPGFGQQEIPIPASLLQVVQARLSRLSETALTILSTVASLHPKADRDRLLRTGDTPGEQIDAALRELVRAHLVEPDPEGQRYRVAPDLVRRIVLTREAPGEERRRARRVAVRRRVAVLAGLMGLLAVAGWVAFRPQRAADDAGPPRLLVLSFANQTGDPSLGSIGRISADWISQGLARSGLVRVAPPELEPEAESASLNRIRTLATLAHADLVISGSYYWSGDSLQVQANLVNLKGGSVLEDIGTARALGQSPMPAIESLRQKALARLGARLDPRLAATADVQSKPPTYESYREFAEGLDYWYARRGGLALPHLMRAYALDTSYTLPLLYAIGIHQGEGRPRVADSLVQVLLPRRGELAPYDRALLDLDAAKDPVTAYRAARIAAQIAPGSPVAVSDLPSLALSLNRPREALRYLLAVDRDHGEPSRLPAYWSRLSAALHLVGDYEGQLEAGKQVERRFPDDSRSYFYKVRALAALGRIPELKQELDRSLALQVNPLWGMDATSLHIIAFDELLAHGQVVSARDVVGKAIEFFANVPNSVRAIPMFRFDVARLLVRLGRWEEGRRLYQELLAKGGAIGADSVAIQGEIGLAAVLAGDSAMAGQIDRWLAARGDPYRKGLTTEYRARMAALFGDRDRAVRLLREATAEGTGFGLERHQGFEYQGLRGYPAFEEMMKPGG